MTFSKSTELCNDHHNLILEQFYHLKKIDRCADMEAKMPSSYVSSTNHVLIFQDWGLLQFIL